MKNKIVHNKYRIDRIIAETGSSTVYAVLSLENRDARYVLKVLKKTFPELERNEAFCSSVLKHPNIVPVVETFTEKLNGPGKSFCIVMEYIDGISLSSFLRHVHLKGAGLAVDLGVYIMKHVFDALEYMHSYYDMRASQTVEVVHCDISPSNIMVDTKGTIRLIDFGISDVNRNRQKTAFPDHRITKGKMPYMAPEQIAGTATADRRSDLYSAGVVLYELLTGNQVAMGSSDPPFTEREIREKIHAPGLQEFFIKALQRDPENRFQSAQEMRTALESCTTAIDDAESQIEMAELVDLVAASEPPAHVKQEDTVVKRINKNVFRTIVTSGFLFILALYCCILILPRHATLGTDRLYDVSIRTVPDRSSIIFNGRTYSYSGTSPVVIPQVKQGTYSIQCKKQGFEDAIQSIVLCGNDATVKVVIPFSVPVLLYSDPPGASIIINDDTLDKKTNCTIHWPSTKPLTLSLCRGGYSVPGPLNIRFDEHSFESSDQSLWKIQSIYMNDLKSADTVIQYSIEGIIYKNAVLHIVPADLDISVDGNLLTRRFRRENYPVSLSPGEHVLSGSRKGFDRIEKRFVIDQGSSDTLRFSLGMQVNFDVIDGWTNTRLPARVISVNKKGRNLIPDNARTPCAFTAESFAYTVQIETAEYGRSIVTIPPGLKSVTVRLGTNLTRVRMNFKDKTGSAINAKISLAYSRIADEKGRSIAGYKGRAVVNEKSDADLKLEYGTYRIGVATPGYLSIEKRIVIQKGKANAFPITLQSMP